MSFWKFTQKIQEGGCNIMFEPCVSSKLLTFLVGTLIIFLMTYSVLVSRFKLKVSHLASRRLLIRMDKEVLKILLTPCDLQMIDRNGSLVKLEIPDVVLKRVLEQHEYFNVHVMSNGVVELHPNRYFSVLAEDMEEYIKHETPLLIKTYNSYSRIMQIPLKNSYNMLLEIEREF